MAQEAKKMEECVIPVSYAPALSGEVEFQVSKPGNCAFSELKQMIVSRLTKFIKDFQYQDIDSPDLFWIINLEDGSRRVYGGQDNDEIISSFGDSLIKSIIVEESFGITVRIPNSNIKYGICTFPSEYIDVLKFNIYNNINNCKSPYLELFLNKNRLGSYFTCNECGIKPFDELECKYRRVFENIDEYDKYGIKIKTLTTRAVKVNIFSVFGVDTLKHLIQMRMGLSPKEQRLVSGGKQLEDNKTCQDYRIKENDSVHVVMRHKF